MSLRQQAVAALLSLITFPALAQEPNPELRRFQGHWEVTELVENGNVIPRAAIREWLPSGGRAEIVDNAIIFTSPHDDKKYVKVFSIDATQYPRTIDVSTPETRDGWGIYRFDEDRLIICLADPTEAERPDGFSAAEDSQRMLMVLQKTTAPAATGEDPTEEPVQPSAPAAANTTARVLTDEEVTQMLGGTWRYRDSIGALFISFNTDSTYTTVREVQQLRLFQKVFVQTPVSSGSWAVRNGTLAFTVTSSTDLNRVNKTFEFTVRSISERDFIFVDYLGSVGSAVRVR